MTRGRRIRPAGLLFAAAAALICLPAFGAAPAAASVSPEADPERLLQAGRLSEVESLLASGKPADRHAREILHGRLLAARGRWDEAEARLRSWKQDRARRGGSGDILFWQAWAALHRGRREEADSLLILASAYAGEPAAQKALEYRLAALQDSGAALRDYLLGLPESPAPASRLESLRKVPSASPLRPQARWEEYLFLERAGDPAAFEVLEDLARDPSTLPGRKAAARWAYVRLESHPDSALAAYERLLLEYQQGVPAEFARSRIQALKSAAKQP